MLIYPMLDDRTGLSKEIPAHVGAFIHTQKDNLFGWSCLLGHSPRLETAPSGAVPARVENLAGLPPAFIGVGNLDLFVFEDIQYATRLINSGVSAELLVVPGAYHGFDTIVPDASVSKGFWNSIHAAYRRAFKLG